ncbi:MAG TPA: hypothetical protein VFN10_04820 [Thermoanaerobaculia bacterium]|nr:hypothetical protein [Thermoanaerobaculia bacterium]
MSPEFPLRIIHEDGECDVIDSPDELITAIDSIEAGESTSRVWIRDALDRTVRLRMRHGAVEALELLSP